MFRKSAVAAAMLLVSVAPQVFALGLGEIDMRSALNQPMDAVIELTSASGADIEDIRVSLATLEEHARAGISKSAILADFRFEIEKNAAGKPVIRISSNELIREPYLEFLLELDWPRGRLLRQYTVLIDPPVTMPAVPAVPEAPVTRTVATPAPAPRAPVSKPVQRPVTAPSAPTSVSAPPPPAANEYGPVRRNETLWSIASRLRPGTDISVEQMMLALLRANPHAFDGNNINRLKAGVTLNIPGRDEILSMSARAARAEAQRQFEEWQGQRPSAVAATTPQEAPVSEADGEMETGTTETAAATAAADSEARLQLTAPEGEAVSGAALPGDPALSGGTTDPDELQQQLALAAEEVAAGRAQSAELQSRVGELEEQVTTMQRLLELKDDELARLQQTVGGEEQQTLQAPDAEAEMRPAEAEMPATEAEMRPTDAAPALPAGPEDQAVAPGPSETTPAAAPMEEGQAQAPDLSERAAGLVDRLMENPLMAGLGVLVALLLGGILWASARFRGERHGLDDELTMQRQLVEDAEHESDIFAEDLSVGEALEQGTGDAAVMDEEVDSDPVTEADVYLAYGRIQQAEDVLLAALQHQPDNPDLRLKLLEVYHSGGNVAAFDQVATALHEMVDEDDSRWQKAATMGLALSPHNALYGGGMPAREAAEVTAGPDTVYATAKAASPEPETEAVLAAAEPEPSNTIEFTLDTAADEAEESGEGLLENVDEVTTKLDLARAYIDMDDKDSARSILGEVMEEGNAEQKEEAEEIYSKLA